MTDHPPGVPPGVPMTPARLDVAPVRVTVAALLEEMQTSPMPSWSEAITAVLARHIGKLIAP